MDWFWQKGISQFGPSLVLFPKKWLKNLDFRFYVSKKKYTVNLNTNGSLFSLKKSDKSANLLKEKDNFSEDNFRGAVFVIFAPNTYSTYRFYEKKEDSFLDPIWSNLA